MTDTAESNTNSGPIYPSPNISSTRLTTRALARQACDPCRIRKVKCDTSNQDHGSRKHSLESNAHASSSVNSTSDDSRRCRRCVKLSLTCSYLLPSGVRGPRPRRKEKEQQVASTTENLPEPYVSPSTSLTLNDGELLAQIQPVLNSPRIDSSRHVSESHESMTYSPAPNLQRWSVSPLSTPSLSAMPLQRSRNTHIVSTDDLCSRELIHRMMNDYLDWLYPLIPVVHRPSFRRDLQQNRDQKSADFLGLVLALCAVTVGTMPSRFREYQSFRPPIPFHTRTEMIDTCWKLILDLRGSHYFDEINHQKWASSYLVQVALFQIGELNRSRMIEVESMQLARLLNLHRIEDYDGLNCIETQLRKKAFWLMFYGYVHAQHQNIRKERLSYLDDTLLQAIKLEDMLPAEVDDEYIFPAHTATQPSGLISTTAGFNVHSRVFWYAVTSIRPSSPQPCNCDRNKSAGLKLGYLRQRLYSLKHSLENIPREFQPWTMSTLSSSSSSSSSLSSATTLLPNTPATHSMSPQERRILNGQLMSMRANISITHLWLQSIIWDQIDTIFFSSGATGPSTQPIFIQHDDASRPSERLSPSDESYGPIPNNPRANWAGRINLCRQVLQVLADIPEQYIEPNGHHLTYKVRDVAVTLLAFPLDGAGEELEGDYSFLWRQQQQQQQQQRRGGGIVPDATVATPASHEEIATNVRAYMSEFNRKLSRLDGSERENTMSLQSWIDTDKSSGGGRGGGRGGDGGGGDGGARLSRSTL